MHGSEQHLASGCPRHCRWQRSHVGIHWWLNQENKCFFLSYLKLHLGDYLANCRSQSPVHQISNHCLFSNVSVFGCIQKVEGLRRGSSSQEYILIFQRIRVLFPAPTSGGSQLLINLVPGHPMPLASTVTCVHVLIFTYAHIHIFKNKIFLKSYKHFIYL